MTARSFDLYDLTSPFVAPTAPSATVTAQRSAYIKRVMDMCLFRVSARTGLFAGVLLLLGQVLAVTWIGQVTGEDNMMLWLAVIASGNIIAGVLTLLAMWAFDPTHGGKA
jgi:ABC-type enterochelin transport system permease subunit